MSYNPKRRLLRHALHAEGWRTSSPKSGRRRGMNRRAAEANVEKAKRILSGR